MANGDNLHPEPECKNCAKGFALSAVLVFCVSVLSVTALAASMPAYICNQRYSLRLSWILTHGFSFRSKVMTWKSQLQMC